MHKTIVSLVLHAIAFICFSMIGIYYAITQLAWQSLLSGGLITIYMTITIGDIGRIIAARTEKKHQKAEKN